MTGAILAFVVLSLLLTACSSSRPTPFPIGGTSAAKTWWIVALGDSVPCATNCNCTPYPPLTADGLSTNTGDTVSANNDAVAGATTSSVLQELQSDTQVIERVRTADAVEIEVGANDVAYSSTCGTAIACFEPHIPTIEANLKAIVSRVHTLTSGHYVVVVLLDYWSVWLGGQYATAQGETYVDSAARITDKVNAIIKWTAASSGSSYVDLRAAFKGPSYAYDETHSLTTDGDHPNAAGHKQIAAATQTVIESTLHI